MTLDYIKTKFNLDLNGPNPVIIPNFGRDNLADLFRELNFKRGAEIGILGGDYSEVILKANPDVEFYGIDPWNLYRDYKDYRTQNELDAYRDAAFKIYAQFPKATILEKYSLEASKDFEDNSLDFVYIDANHDLMHAVEDIVTWTHKVKPGGIVSGHDYFRSKWGSTKVHIIPALNAYTDAYRIHPLFVLGNYRAEPGEIRDKRRSWMFIKELK